MANKTTLEVVVPDSTDRAEFLTSAGEVFDAFYKVEAALRAQVAEVAVKALESNPTVRKWNASTLSRIVVPMMGELPNDKACKTAEPRCSAFLASLGDTYLHIKAGPNAGFHEIAKYDAAELAKLQKKA